MRKSAPLRAFQAYSEPCLWAGVLIKPRDVDLGGTNYNTNTQVEDLEVLLRKLPNPTTPAPPPAKRPKPRRARQLDADQVQELIQGYTTGATTHELGNRFGIGQVRA